MLPLYNSIEKCMNKKLSRTRLIITVKIMMRKLSLLLTEAYESFNTIVNFRGNNAHFVLCAKDVKGKISMLSTLGLPQQDEFDVDAKYYQTLSTSADARANPRIYKYIRDSPLDYMPEGQYALYYMTFRLVRIRFSDEYGGNYQSIITNLPRYEFSEADIKNIYAKRW